MNKSDAVLLLETYKKEANEYTEEYSFLLPVIEFLLTGDAELPEVEAELELESETPPQTVFNCAEEQPRMINLTKETHASMYSSLGYIFRKYKSQYPNYIPEQIWADMHTEISECAVTIVEKLCQK